MGTRLELHNELLKLCPNVYFTPPPTIKLTYPCIIYTKTAKRRLFGNDELYITNQEYDITVINNNPVGDLDDVVERSFKYCTITQYYVTNNLNHTKLSLYY